MIVCCVLLTCLTTCYPKVLTKTRCFQLFPAILTDFRASYHCISYLSIKIPLSAWIVPKPCCRPPLIFARLFFALVAHTGRFVIESAKYPSNCREDISASPIGVGLRDLPSASRSVFKGFTPASTVLFSRLMVLRC